MSVKVIAGIKQSVKNMVLKVLEPYNIRYISPSDQKLLAKARKAKKKAAKEKKAALEKEYEIQAEMEAIEAEKQAAIDVENMELVELKEWLGDTDKNHVWVFNAGNDGQAFRGNPKFLFAYVNYYRPDVKAIWICRTDEIIEQIRNLGFRAYHLSSPAAGYAIGRVGVVVSEQVRGIMPFDESVKYLNLWHGWGFKPVERARVDDDDDLKFDLCPKYIKFNSFYQNNQILCVVNAIQENYFLTQMGVGRENILRCGYARCLYQKTYRPIVTFDHDILGAQGLPEDTKIAVYAPTFRKNRGNTFASALPDLMKLYERCEQNHMLLIFKMHPLMESETLFLTAKSTFAEKPYFMFWDNQNDIYEIMHKVDLLIYDYSSIFSDFLLAGVQHFIRYLFDGEDMAAAAGMNDDQEYYDNSRGRICRTFDELLAGIDRYEEDDEEEELGHFIARAWEYAGDDDLAKMVDSTLAFQIKDTQYPTLYSYDIFDTLLTRKGLAPDSIFFAMRDRMRADTTMGFARAFVERFPLRRKHTELGVREYMNKSLEQRATIKREVTLEQIYREIQILEDLTDEQTEYLIKLECDIEIDSVIPLPEQIDRIKELLAAGEKVILISDMYLPRDVIQKMLYKADPVLTTLELFLSNEYGTLKTDRLLFFEVYRSIKPFYYYGKWIHTGDNIGADQNQPRRMNIETRLVKKPEFTDIESSMVQQIGNYDAYKVAAMQARIRERYDFSRSDFVADFVAPLWVSYVDWAIRDAMKNGFETLYFVSRDGHPLKRIADALIETHGWKIKTKYIYASRRVWRVPSYIDKVDDEFFATYGGNFNDIHSKEKFISAACFEDEEHFKEVLPQIDLDSIDFNDWSDGQPGRKLARVLQANEAYHQYLLEYAAKYREISCEYLRQEVDPNEKHAYVEFFGRGYNQTCHSRIWNYAIGREVPLHYYYAHVLFPSEGNCIRHRMTTTDIQMFFIESLFANMPYKSIAEYERSEDGKIIPVKYPADCDMELFIAMEQLLPEYAREYAKLSLDDPMGLDKNLFDFQVFYFENNKTSPFIYNNFGGLVDAVSIYGDKKVFARPYTKGDIDKFMNGIPRGRGTMSITMSYYRSSPAVRKRYDEIYQLEPGDNVAGGTLLKTPAELANSAKFKKQLESNMGYASRFGKFYKKMCAETVVQSRVTLICDTKDDLPDSLYSICAALQKQDTFTVHVFLGARQMNGPEKQQMARVMAKSRYVLLCGTVPYFSGLELREGSTLVMLGASAFTLVKRGYGVSLKLKSEKKHREFLYRIRANEYDAPSDVIAEEICAEYALSPHNAQMLPGNAATDVYASQEYREAALEQLYEIFPEARDKKLLLYVPRLRKREHNQRYYELLDLEALHRAIGAEYVMIFDARGQKNLLTSCANRIEIEGFSKIINDEMRLRELVSVADVIVGDYRDTVFEAVLVDRPIYFTGFDYEKVQRDVNFIRDFSRLMPFPMVRTAEELVEQLRHIEDYDYVPMHAFKEKYLTYCDGHVGEKIVEHMIAVERANPSFPAVDEPEELEEAEADEGTEAAMQTDTEEENEAPTETENQTDGAPADTEQIEQ